MNRKNISYEIFQKILIKLSLTFVESDGYHINDDDTFDLDLSIDGLNYNGDRYKEKSIDAKMAKRYYGGSFSSYSDFDSFESSSESFDDISRRCFKTAKFLENLKREDIFKMVSINGKDILIELGEINCDIVDRVVDTTNGVYSIVPVKLSEIDGLLSQKDSWISTSIETLGFSIIKKYDKLEFLMSLKERIIVYSYILKNNLYLHDDVYILETKMMVYKKFIESLFDGEDIKFDFDNLDVYSYYFLKPKDC